MSELKAITVYDAYWKTNSVGEGTGILVYLKSEADKVITEKDTEIAELKQKLAEKESWVKMLGEGEAALSLELENTKQKLESVQASMYCDVVDANMENRRLRRALYKACAMWADRTRLICSVFGSSAPKIRWERMLDKCRAKAEEYR